MSALKTIHSTATGSSPEKDMISPNKPRKTIKGGGNRGVFSEQKRNAFSALDMTLETVSEHEEQIALHIIKELRKYNVFKDIAINETSGEGLEKHTSDVYRKICSNNDVIESSLRNSRITQGKLKKYLTRRYN